MSLFNPKNEEEEEQYLPAKLTDQLPDQSLSEEVRDRLRKKGYKRRLRIFSDVIAPMKILGFVLIFISLSYLIVTQLKYLFFQTSYFELKDFEVVGNTVLDSDYILKKAGIAPAQNVFSLETDEIRQRLLEEPLIKDIKVELSSLNSLRISVTERTPIIYAKKGIAFYEISEDGVILNTEGMGEKDLPIFTGLNLENTNIGDSIANHDDFFIAKTWLKNLGKNIFKEISEINLSTPQNPFIIMLSGEKIYPRSAEDMKNRFVFLRALLDNLQKNNVETFYLDMRALNDIVIRPKKLLQTNSENRGNTTGE